MAWIKCEERLPEHGKTVLLHGGIGFLSAHGVWYTQMKYPPRPIEWKVMHWMPYPDPPTD